MIDFQKYSKNFLTSPDNGGCVNGVKKYSEACQTYVKLVRIAFQKKKKLKKERTSFQISAPLLY
jgi:hypothetical protein